MIRTRIAPSPTGYLHIGTARTALFNYLYAKKNGGSFIVRIEDTDTERSKKEFEKDILDGLSWLDIRWDEGPGVGGPNGPYYQSGRIDLYEKYLLILFDAGKLYPCYCTKEELERERELQILSRKPPKYSGICRDLTPAQRADREREGRQSTLRFALEERVVTVTDLIRGELSFDTKMFDDFIVAKDFRTPLYNFAVVVDDAHMQITHVIRGEEHISNIPKQVMLASALGFEIPQFAHLSLILNPDRTKLSKRQNKVSLLEYRADGYLPEAIINFIALLGWNPGGTRELFSLDELSRIFDLDHVNKSGAVFDGKKLDWFNNHYIREKNLDEATALALPYFEKIGVQKSNSACYTYKRTGEAIDGETLRRIVEIERERISRLSEITDRCHYFFEAELSYDSSLLLWKEMTPADAQESLRFSQAILAKQDDYAAHALEIALKEGIVAGGKKNGTILWPLRVALSGLQSSPPPFDIASIIGKDKTLARIQSAIDMLAR